MVRMARRGGVGVSPCAHTQYGEIVLRGGSVVTGMPDEETSSGTLRERLESIPYEQRTGNPSLTDVADDGIEYAAQLEAEVERLESALNCGEEHCRWVPGPCHHHLKEFHTEARAERDRLLDALGNLIDAVDDHGEMYGNVALERAMTLYAEVERGDTVERIRREAFKEAAALVERPEYISRLSERKETASAICALGEADDQEEDDDEAPA